MANACVTAEQNNLQSRPCIVASHLQVIAIKIARKQITKTQEPQKQKYLNVGPTTQVVRCKYKDSREKDAVVKWMNDYRLSVCHKCNHLAEAISKCLLFHAP